MYGDRERERYQAESTQPYHVINIIIHQMKNMQTQSNSYQAKCTISKAYATLRNWNLAVWLRRDQTQWFPTFCTKHINTWCKVLFKKRNINDTNMMNKYPRRATRAPRCPRPPGSDKLFVIIDTIHIMDDEQHAKLLIFNLYIYIYTYIHIYIYI